MNPEMNPNPSEMERANDIFLWLINYESVNSWLILFLPTSLALKYFTWKVKRKLKNMAEFQKFKAN